MSETRKIYRLRDILEVARSPIDMKDEEDYMLASIRRRNGGMFDRETKKGKEILTKTLNRVIPGSFVISKMQVVHGACGMAPLDFGDRCISASYASLLPTEPQRIDIGYLDAYATTKQSYDAFFRASHGVHIEKMTFNLEEWLSREIELPPLPEQKKIAKILSGIDTTMGNLKSYLAKQEILKKSVVSKLIFNRDDDYRRIGETDRHSCLADVSTRITDGTHQAVKTSKTGTIPFLYISCIKDGIIDWSKSAFISEEQYAVATQGRQPSSGDILYTVVGSYGNAVMVSTSNRFCFQRHIALIQLDQKQVEPKFIEIALCSEEVKKSVDQVVAGNAQPTLTLGELRKLQIPLPSLDMQRRICEIISPLELKISALEKKIKAMKSLKTAMSSDLLSGRKRVSI